MWKNKDSQLEDGISRDENLNRIYDDARNSTNILLEGLTNYWRTCRYEEGFQKDEEGNPQKAMYILHAIEGVLHEAMDEFRLNFGIEGLETLVKESLEHQQKLQKSLDAETADFEEWIKKEEAKEAKKAKKKPRSKKETKH
tara:strand:- start:36 stop:458 length:423 start_codon:yes stop_codon:yes gene_type:complete